MSIVIMQRGQEIQPLMPRTARAKGAPPVSLSELATAGCKCAECMSGSADSQAVRLPSRLGDTNIKSRLHIPIQWGTATLREQTLLLVLDRCLSVQTDACVQLYHTIKQGCLIHSHPTFEKSLPAMRLSARRQRFHCPMLGCWRKAYLLLEKSTGQGH